MSSSTLDALAMRNPSSALGRAGCPRRQDFARIGARIPEANVLRERSKNSTRTLNSKGAEPVAVGTLRPPQPMVGWVSVPPP